MAVGEACLSCTKSSYRLRTFQPSKIHHFHFHLCLNISKHSWRPQLLSIRNVKLHANMAAAEDTRSSGSHSLLPMIYTWDIPVDSPVAWTVFCIDIRCKCTLLVGLAASQVWDWDLIHSVLWLSGMNANNHISIIQYSKKRMLLCVVV